jgi:ABC-type amino acid transport substrate-binding protein
MKHLLLLLLFSFATFAYSQQELNLASDVWPPFTDVEGEKSISFDIVKEALVRNSIVVNMDILEFDEVISEIKTNKYDGSAALWINDKRAAYLLYSDPYMHNQLILVGRKGSDVSAHDFNELKNVKIGVVSNYAYDIKGTEENGIQLISGKSDQKNLEALLSKKVDYILIDDLIIQYLIKYQTNDVSEFLSIGENPLFVKSLHFALNKNVEHAQTIIKDFNTQIDAMLTDGSYNEILGLNWIRADVDGDGKLELVLIGNKAGTHPPEHPYDIENNQEGTSTGGYYINGKYYATWDEIPANAKVPMGNPDLEGTYTGPFLFNF